jgi:hypothetical protein
MCGREMAGGLPHSVGSGLAVLVQLAELDELLLLDGIGPKPPPSRVRVSLHNNALDLRGGDGLVGAE